MRDLYIPYSARKLATAQEMREFDRISIQDYGIPGIVLMENAARHVVDTIKNHVLDPHGKRIAVVCGKGNNGGDGFASARMLASLGATVAIWLLGDPADVKGDAQINLKRLACVGLDVRPIDSIEVLMDDMRSSDLVVDALFGTGFKGSLTGKAADVIRSINSAGKPIVSVDVPSGLDADTGLVTGPCVKALVTPTFALAKIGLFSYPGAEYAGTVFVGDIGIPGKLYERVLTEIIHPKWVKDNIPRRDGASHKGTYGTCVTIAGSRGMSGAAALASEAVLRSGAGLSILCVPSSLQPVMMVKLTEVMTRGLKENENGAFSSEASEEALDVCDKASSAVVGCGIGQSDEMIDFMSKIVTSLECPLVVDADGLNNLAKSVDVLKSHKRPLVITPHPAEMARLMGTTTEEIQSKRLMVARKAASLFNSIVVLKGAGTIVAHPDGRAFINPTGNPGMATGGTGDVLAGTIGGLIAQGIDEFEAAACGVYLHGLAGDIAAEKMGEPGMTAGDLLRSLPYAIKQSIKA